jgi:hypothetical protein
MSDNRVSALETFRQATQCSDHRDDSISELDLGEVIYYGDNGSDEFASVAVFRAVSGDGLIVAIESSDYTGHGCQCSGSAGRFATLDAALRLGLTREDAEMCGATEARDQAIQKLTESEPQ